jgi:DnaK suppressor protein
MTHGGVFRTKRSASAQGTLVTPGLQRTAPRLVERDRHPSVQRRSMEACRAALQAERWKLMLALENTEVMEIPAVADSMDSSALEHERHVALDTLSRKVALLAEVNAALERLRAGTYGLCEECEQPISPGRLGALPWARLCLRCQEEEEVQGQVGSGETSPSTIEHFEDRAAGESVSAPGSR